MGLELHLLGARTRYFTTDPLRRATQPANHQTTNQKINHPCGSSSSASFFLSYLHLFILYVCTYITVCMYVWAKKKKVPKEV